VGAVGNIHFRTIPGIEKDPFQDSSWQWKESVSRYELLGLGRIHLETVPGNRTSFSIVPDSLKGPFLECQQWEEYVRTHSSRQWKGSISGQFLAIRGIHFKTLPVIVMTQFKTRFLRDKSLFEYIFYE
jgi:hypothetical protein